MVDTGREPYAKQFETVAEILNPAHPSMPHIDQWHEPQYNPAKPGGAAESEYSDRYLGVISYDSPLFIHWVFNWYLTDLGLCLAINNQDSGARTRSLTMDLSLRECRSVRTLPA